MARLSAAESTLVEDKPEKDDESVQAEDEKPTKRRTKRRDFKICTVHSKKRLLKHLVKGADGAYKCRAGIYCLAKGTLAPRMKATLVMCSVHNKLRHPQSVEKDGHRGFKCTEKEPCKLSHALSAADLEKDRCSKHGKKRSMISLRDDGEGGKCCIDSNPCFTAETLQKQTAETLGPTVVMCSLHQKERSMTCVQADGKGGFTCMRKFRCRHANGETNFHGGMGKPDPEKRARLAAAKGQGKGRGYTPKGYGKGRGRGFGGDESAEVKDAKKKIGKKTRERLFPERVEGTLTVWNQKKGFGFIEPDEEIDHELFERKNGCLYFTNKDLVGEKEELESKYPIDSRVTCAVYATSLELIAGEIEPLVK